jgi:hypothetical protein
MSPDAATAWKRNGKWIREAAKDVVLEVETPERAEDVVDELVDDDEGDEAEDGGGEAKNVDVGEGDAAEDVDVDEGDVGAAEGGGGAAEAILRNQDVDAKSWRRTECTAASSAPSARRSSSTKRWPSNFSKRSASASMARRGPPSRPPGS